MKYPAAPLAAAAFLLAAVAPALAQSDTADLRSDEAPKTAADALAIDPADAQMRVQIAMRSADKVLAGLEKIVSGLAAEPDAYDELLFPTLDIFLIGVDTARTLRFDLIQPAEGDSRLNMMIPLSDTKDFLKDNLEPTGIEYKRRSSTYYELEEVYEGHLRIVDGYGVMSKKGHEEDAPEGMASPAEGDARLFAKPADIAVLIDAASGSPAERRAVAEALGRQRVEAIERREDESEAVFNLRRTMAENRAGHLPNILGGIERMLFGYETQTDTGTGRSHLVIEAAEGTEMAELIEGVGTPDFLFAGVPTVDDPIYTGRLAWPMTENRKARWAEALEASRAVAAERLDEQEPAPSDDRRAAQGELSEATYDFLKANLDQPLLGVFTEMRAAGGKTYTAAAGVQSVDGTALKDVLAKVPAAVEGAELKVGVATIAGPSGEVELHELTIPSLSQPIQDFIGGTTVTVGTSAGGVYVAGGPGGVDLLTESLKDVEAKPTQSILTMRAHLGPVARLLDSVMTKRGVSLIEFMQARREERLERRQDADEARRLQVTNPAAWREAALEALLDKPDDVLTTELKKVDGRIEGETTLGTSILAAVGELIAKFAKENL